MSILGNKKQKPAEGAVAAAKPKAPRRQVDKRNKSLKTISITSTIIFLVILLVINILFDNFLGDILKWDWTPGQQYSIGNVSKEILASMSQDVEIVGLFDDKTDTQYTDIQEMLQNYAKASNGRISVRYVDPVKNPAILKEVDPEGFLDPEANSFVVRCAATGKAKMVTNSDIFDYEIDYNTYQQYLTGVTAEQSFTGAIKYVQSDKTPVIYFSTGHQELAYETDYSLLVKILRNNNFDVKSLELFNKSEIPADCSTLIIADPQQDISTAESKLILSYLKKGGGLMVITDYGNAAFPELNNLLLDFNLEISNDKIREGDTNYRYNNDPYVIRAIAPTSTITPSAVDGWTLADNIRAINALKNTKDWIAVSPILTTSRQGVLETGGDASRSSEPGTQYFGYISDNQGFIDGKTVTRSAKVMAVGSASLFTDSTLQISSQLYNVYLFYYGIQWLSDSAAADDLYIAAKTPTSYNITAGSENVKVFTAVLVIIILPGLLLLAALMVYRKRRHL
jgi:hypothetical protein